MFSTTPVVLINHLLESNLSAMANDDQWYVIVDDQSPSIQYEGQWFNEAVEDAFNSTLSLTTTAGSSALFKFRGNHVAARGAVLFQDANNPPVASFSIDGQTPAIFVPPLSANGTIPATFFVSPQLSDAEHTLNVTVLSNDAPFFLDYILFNATSTAEVTASSSQPTIITTVIVLPTSAPNSLTADASKSVPVGPIVGGVLGGLALLVGVVLALYFLCWRRRHDGRYFYVPTVNDAEGKPGIIPFPVSSSRPQPPPIFSQTLPTHSLSTEHDPSVYSEPSQYLPTEFVPSPLYPPTQRDRSQSFASMPTTSISTNFAMLPPPASAPLTAAQRKRAEAARRVSPEPVLHSDSGYRFDQSGSSSGARPPDHDPEYPPEFPPSYSEA